MGRHCYSQLESEWIDTVCLAMNRWAMGKRSIEADVERQGPGPGGECDGAGSGGMLCAAHADVASGSHSNTGYMA